MKSPAYVGYVTRLYRLLIDKYYNNEELPDEKWQGSSRMYPWNELKLRIAQYENGQPTGKYYAVYFTGALTHMDGNDQVPGAGKNILVYHKNANGELQLARYDQGKLYENRNAADPSLSHMNTNVTGEDIYFDMQITNEDITASDIGKQTIILYACNFDSVTLAAFDADSDDVLTESLNFTVERFELPEKFKVMDGMM